MTRMQELKAPIRAFMRVHYTDERLALLLCHARDGKLSYVSCCCFIGVATADHALRGQIPYDELKVEPHYVAAKELAVNSGRLHPGACYSEMGQGDSFDVQDALRRRILIPMIRAEMKRRERLRPSEPSLAVKDTVRHPVEIDLGVRVKV